MRDHSHHIELSRDEAVRQMLALLEDAGFGERAPEQVALAKAYGRTLAADVAAAADVPSVLTCCMDSVAVRFDAFEGLPEGELPDTSAWVRGRDWEFANTGAAMPEGFDTAIVVEHAAISDDESRVTFDAAPSRRFAGTRAPGSKMRRGDVVAPAGTLVTPDVAAIIAGAGHEVVLVRPRPRVAFIPTGNELVPANVPFAEGAPERFAGRGRTFESNGYVVRGRVEEWGGQLVPFDIVPDEREAIARAIERAVAVADIVVLNAGSSKGSDDWSVEVLEERGRMVCHQTNHGPGHHSSYALVDGVPVVGISGPPAGASFTLNFYLKPLMLAFRGLDPLPKAIPARLAAPFPAGGPHRKMAPGIPLAGEQRPLEATEPGQAFFSVRFVNLSVGGDGMCLATPVPGHAGSPETQHANAFYLMPAAVDDNPPAVGDLIAVELR